MRMAVETSLGVAVCGFIASQVPDDQSLVSASREKHVWTMARVSVFQRQSMRHRTFREM